jgi:hypothetical protein
VIQIIALAFCLTLALAACAPALLPTMAGADRDAHGCIPSAGYAWCARTQRCERPWELAEERGFAASAEAFAKFCGAARE